MNILIRILALLAIAILVAFAAFHQSDSTPEAGGSALLDFAEQGDLSALNALLKPSTKVDVRDSCDWTPLMKAALYGHLDVVERLLDAGADIDAQDKGGYTAMMLAASNNHAPIVDLLLSKGAMIDHQEQTEGWTALIWTAGKGHAKTVEVLLRHGADETLKDFAGRTAEDHAREAGHQAVAEQLAERSR
ncbi:ankyrin repeat domain-containing protein [Thiocapsa sp.]|uniref:ankyrin repeat domain-containing protein n=1 Tax=Thiocapsa sp. TaxID=2024551 RepID=UPI002BFCD929|nr:ankyrin repeat domain-containing protein [Thiocapsa sp.]HSO84800.1 ankyrin repeat domain-containing protein [Thiocapsa sp.]